MDLLCSYASKPCAHPRALRPNGQLHNFCEEHRRKANEAQKRWYDRHNERPRNRPMATGVSVKREPGAPSRRRASSTKARGYASKPYGRVTFRTADVPAFVPAAEPSFTEPLPLPDFPECSLESLLLDFHWEPAADETLVGDCPTLQSVNEVVFYV